jgi:hypothetical protein
VTEGIRIYAFAVDRERPRRKPLSRLPLSDGVAPTYSWDTWEVPRYRTEPKHGVGAIRAALNAIPDRVVAPVATHGEADAR